MKPARANLMRVRIDTLDERRLGYFARLVDQAGRSPALAAVLREPRIAAIAGPPPVAATPAKGPAIVGPAQKQARQGIIKRAEANKKVRERRRAERKQPASGLASPPPPIFVPATAVNRR